MYRRLVIWLGKSLIVVMRAIGKGGAALPGLVVEKVYPKFIPKMAAQFSESSILVTGTNGKTTTTKLIAGILKSARKRLVTNNSGSNMSRGIASALLEASDWQGNINAQIGLFEVDEAFMEDVAVKLKPKVVVVLNLLRDQLDRYGELDHTAELIAAGLAHTQAAVLNADDPLVAHLATAVSGGQVIFFGATDELKAHLPHDAAMLKKLAKKYQQPVTSELNLVLSSAAPTDSGQAISVEYHHKNWKTTLRLAGVYNAYNALAALACVTFIKNLSFKQALDMIAKVEPAFGRTEVIKLGDKKLQLLLVKNPAGFNQVIKTFLANSNAPVLMAVNDNFADGRDVSWLYDVEFEKLSQTDRTIIATGVRGNDLAVRLKYADIKSQVQLDFKPALAELIDRVADGGVGYIVPTYTAMLALRRLLAKKTEVTKTWQ